MSTSEGRTNLPGHIMILASFHALVPTFCLVLCCVRASQASAALEHSAGGLIYFVGVIPDGPTFLPMERGFQPSHVQMETLG